MSATNETTELRYWLINEDWYMSQYAKNWLDRTPHDEAIEVLAELAEEAQPEPSAAWSVAMTLFATAGLATSTGIMGEGPDSRKAGVRAALMLADLGDPRAIAPLGRVMGTKSVLKSKYLPLIEKALTRLLPKVEERPNASRYASDVQQLVECVWVSEGRGDLTASHAALLLNAVHFLHAVGVKTLPVLTTIKESNHQGANRLRVKEAVLARSDV